MVRVNTTPIGPVRASIVTGRTPPEKLKAMQETIVLSKQGQIVARHKRTIAEEEARLRKADKARERELQPPGSRKRRRRKPAAETVAADAGSFSSIADAAPSGTIAPASDNPSESQFDPSNELRGEAWREKNKELRSTLNAASDWWPHLSVSDQEQLLAMFWNKYATGLMTLRAWRAELCTLKISVLGLPPSPEAQRREYDRLSARAARTREGRTWGGW
jgi:hypothetical protein